MLDLDEKVAIIALQQEIVDLYFKMSLAKHPPREYELSPRESGEVYKDKGEHEEGCPSIG